MLAKFRRRKQKEKEAKQAKGRGGDSDERMMPSLDNITTHNEIQPPKVETNTSQGSAQDEPMTRRRYHEVTETLIKLQSMEAKRRKLDEQRLKGEDNRRDQGLKGDRSKLRATSTPVSSSKKPKLNNADPAFELLAASSTSSAVKRPRLNPVDDAINRLLSKR